MLHARRVVGRLIEIAGRRRQRRDAERLLDLPERPGNDEPDEKRDQADKGQVVNRDADARRHATPGSASTPGRMAAAITKARKRSATTRRRRQTAMAKTPMPSTTSVQTAARRAVPESSSKRSAPLSRAGPWTHLLSTPAHPLGANAGACELPVWAGSPTQADVASRCGAERLGIERHGQVSQRCVSGRRRPSRPG